MQSEKVELLRRQYPDPRISGFAGNAQTRCYCVGGTLCLSQGHPEGFPSPWTLAEALQTENPSLGDYQALTLAAKITSANDTGDFNGAWRWMEHALTVEQEKEYGRS